MDNLEWLKSVKEADKDTLESDIDWFSHRKIKALEIIAESLINIDINLNILTAVIENADIRNLKY